MKMTPTKRFAVRTTLVTGTTLATIIGAQALVSLDEDAFSATPPASVAPVELTPQQTGNTSMALPTNTPSTTVLKAAPPTIVILRHAGQNPSAVAPATNTIAINPPVAVIQPPNPVQVVAPQPVPQQQSAPAVAQTRSTR